MLAKKRSESEGLEVAEYGLTVSTVTPEEMQATLARARQSAVLEERNRLAGEIHHGWRKVLLRSAYRAG